MSEIKFHGLFFSFLLFISSVAIAAPKECKVFFETQPEGNYLRKDVEIPDDIMVKNKKAKDFIGAQVKKYSGEVFDGTTFDEAIDQVYNALRKDASLDPLKRGEKLALFGREMHPVWEDMLKKTPIVGDITNPNIVAWEARRAMLNQVKTSKYNLARKIIDLESFVKTEFKVVAKEKMVLTQGTNFTKLTHMKLKDYPKYIDSYLHYLNKPNSTKAKLYKNIDEGSLGILSISDIRDITSYNVWPMYAKSHDIRHIHFALTHPMAVAAMMTVTRSKNHMRYALVAGIYEGVDRLQYSHESALTKFFGQSLSSQQLFGIERNMDLEEAMLTLATASKADLKKISDLAGADVDLTGNSGWGLFNGMQTWQPKKVSGKLNGNAIDGETFEEEINDMTEQFTKLLNKSEKIKAKLRANPELGLTKAEEHFMKMMNFQLNPNDPEIVIDGIRFKNDGRAHSGSSWDSDDGAAAIGIGDL